MIKKTAILQMLYGERGNAECIEFGSEHFELLGKTGECYENLKNSLKSMPEAWNIFMCYKDLTDEANADEAETYYIEGFKFGVLMGLEIGESKSK